MIQFLIKSIYKSGQIGLNLLILFILVLASKSYAQTPTPTATATYTYTPFKYNARVYKPNADKMVCTTGGTIEIESGCAFSQVTQKLINSGYKVGATAGWDITGDNVASALLPASQTGSTLVIPVSGLSVGDVITGFQIEAQIESAGGTVTLDAVLYKTTNVAADPTETNLGAITQVSVTADTKSEPSKTLAAQETVAVDEQFYILVTATTAASTDIQLLGAVVSVTGK